MGLFGPSKIKISPNDFVKEQLDMIFSQNFQSSEYENFKILSSEFPILKNLNFDFYLRERRNVVIHLLQIAWDRNIPYDIFIKYNLIIDDDPRVKSIDSGIYQRSLSRAKEAGLDIFYFIADLFVKQIIPKNIDISDSDFLKLIYFFKVDLTNIYLAFEGLIKKYKFI